jgi:hypothetical protein
MVLDPRLGEHAFDELLSKHPEDGMVFYERGEAFEYLGDLQRARQDYERAEQLILMPQWKAVVRRALQRVTIPESFKTAPAQWIASHAVHLVPEAPHKLRVMALSALARIDSEQSAVGDLRTCLEEMVDDLCRTFAPEIPPREELEVQIRMLRGLRVAPEDVVDAMDLLRRIGNKGVHPGHTLEPQQVDDAIRSFIQVLGWCRDNIWRLQLRDSASA